MCRRGLLADFLRTDLLPLLLLHSSIVLESPHRTTRSTKSLNPRAFTLRRRYLVPHTIAIAYILLHDALFLVFERTLRRLGLFLTTWHPSSYYCTTLPNSSYFFTERHLLLALHRTAQMVALPHDCTVAPPRPVRSVATNFQSDFAYVYVYNTHHHHYHHYHHHPSADIRPPFRGSACL